jgi:hypothetical protein
VLPKIAALVALAVLAMNAPASAEDEPAGRRDGHPTVVLDLLDLSKTPGAAPEEKFLRDVLAKEVRRLDWGAGKGSRIEYRLAIEELSVSEGKDVVRVTCGARGWLPKGHKAKSRVTFGGSPQDRRAVVRHVLEIVARGVVTRLAELERNRRSE